MHKRGRTRLRDARKQRGWSQEELAALLNTTQHNVSRWELGLTTPGVYFRTLLCRLFGQSAAELDLPASQSEEPERLAPPNASTLPLDFPAYWSVPHPRNPFFTGREALLRALHDAFASPEPGTQALQSYALCGMGGMGKTQLAL